MHQALVWALEHDPAAALRMAVALGPWWMLRDAVREGYAWLRAAAERVAPGDPAWCAGLVLLGETTQDLREALGQFIAVRDAMGGRSVTGASRCAGGPVGLPAEYGPRRRRTAGGARRPGDGPRAGIRSRAKWWP